jgi:hypothetical protein
MFVRLKKVIFGSCATCYGAQKPPRHSMGDWLMPGFKVVMEINHLEDVF